MGERLGGFIYGTVVVLSVLVAGARAYPGDAGRIALLAVVTSLVFWLAHVYAHGIADSVARGERVSPVHLRHIARRESSIVEAAARDVPQVHGRDALPARDAVRDPVRVDVREPEHE